MKKTLCTNGQIENFPTQFRTFPHWAAKVVVKKSDYWELKKAVTLILSIVSALYPVPNSVRTFLIKI